MFNDFMPAIFAVGGIVLALGLTFCHECVSNRRTRSTKIRAAHRTPIRIDTAAE